MKTIAISDELHAELTNLKLKYKFKTLEKLLKYMLYEFRKKKLFDIKIKI